MSENTLPPVKVAFVINGEIVDILHTDERLSNILLANPTVLNVTGADGEPEYLPGDLYDAETGTFTKMVFIDSADEE
jgi:hypothetical protein